MILPYPPDSNMRLISVGGNGMLSGTLILAGRAIIMSLPKLVGNSICLESNNGIRYTDPVY
jgi:hypothetical protein